MLRRVPVLAAIAMFALVFGERCAPLRAQTAASEPTTPAARCLRDAVAITRIGPQIPAGVREQGAGGTVQVRVGIDVEGHPSLPEIVKSSGWQILDDVTIEAAMSSTYRPAVRECRPFASTYLYTVVFELGAGFRNVPLEIATHGSRARVERIGDSDLVYSCSTADGKPLEFRMVSAREIPRGVPYLFYPPGPGPAFALERESCMTPEGTPGVIQVETEPKRLTAPTSG